MVFVVVPLPSTSIWHKEIEDIIVLKNKGTEDNRVRKLDYFIQISKLFYTRFIQNGEIPFPRSTPGLYDAFGRIEFDALYEKYEADESLRKTVKAQELFLTC